MMQHLTLKTYSTTPNLENSLRKQEHPNYSNLQKALRKNCVKSVRNRNGGFLHTGKPPLSRSLFFQQLYVQYNPSNSFFR